jgi:hypothetical protein
MLSREQDAAFSTDLAVIFKEQGRAKNQSLFESVEVVFYLDVSAMGESRIKRLKRD